MCMENDNIELEKEKKNKKTKKSIKKANKKLNKKSKKLSKNNEQVLNVEQEYFFGHKEGDDIWSSFLINKMIAHRGLWNKDFPENSISAFKNAIENDYAIELDIQPIEDGTPVVFHDSKMSRMTGMNKYIQNITADELEAAKLLDTNEKIPTLEEVLKVVNGKTPLLIEIKNQDKVGELEHAPKIWRGQLASYFKGEKLGIFKKLVLRRLGMKKYTHQNFVSYDISNLPNRFTRKLEIPLLTWTVKKQEEYIKAIQYADNVIFEGFEPKI